MTSLTNETILPLINSLLDVDLSAISDRVQKLVAEAVSHILRGRESEMTLTNISRKA